jgi:beta-mannosidase
MKNLEKPRNMREAEAGFVGTGDCSVNCKGFRVFRGFFLLCITTLLTAPAHAQGKAWTITLEEPTGIFRRDAEVVSIRRSFAVGEVRPDSLYVTGPDGRTLITQIAVESRHPDGSVQAAEILFQASIIPGERPVYRLVTAHTPRLGAPNAAMIARRIGVGRIEMANERFGVILNLGYEGTQPALVAAYNKSAGEMRILNLIDTSPDVTEPLPFGQRSAGFGTFLSTNGNQSSRIGRFDEVEIIESGPLRARVKVSGARHADRRETWEFIWYANSPVLRWRTSLDEPQRGANYGIFFSCISASPYLPFDRWMEGIELRFPDGWETDNPPDHRIGGRDMADLPGRHIVYYQREENYGAFGLFEIDEQLEWKGAGARQFFASKRLDSSAASTEIALSFPRWKGTETVVEARHEYRKFRQPILAVTSSVSEPTDIARSSELIPLINEVPIDELRRAITERVAEFSLDGKWRLNSAEKSEGEKSGFHRADFDDRNWKEVNVPGSVHTQILEAPKYFTREAEWISEKEWWYRRSFDAPPNLAGRRLILRFEATDYYADVYLNGELLGRHEGYIDPYEFDVASRLKFDAPNQLTVRVWTPVSYYWRHRPYTVKGSYGAVDQKPDNITALGITRSVRLIGVGAVRISEVAIDTKLNRDGSADVVVDVEYDSSENVDNARIELMLTPKNFEAPDALRLNAPEQLSAGINRRRYVLRVARPELWWTWDHGRPNLYTLTAKAGINGVLSDAYSHAVGIREIEHIDWKFYLNGKRIFIRGTNYYYHLFQSEVRRSDYERDYKLMQAMNVNMVRLHCNFSNPEFYDLADELGILVWQDYLEAWYPEDRAFSLKAAALYDPHIKYVRNHPSVAIWATSDEESLENYRDLTKHLEPRLYIHDPQRRPVQRSTGRYGDAHVYEGWYGGTIWAYATMTEKFVSELGATALPNYDSLMKFLPNAWPISEHQDEWVFHKLQIFEAMRAWGEPGAKTLQEYIPQTQDYVARLFQLAIERMRRTKYKPAGGILHFHAVDLWPSVTMAAVDFYRQPTKSFYTVQRSFQMVLPSFAYDRDAWASGETIKTELWIVNDHLYELNDVRVSWRLVDENGREVEKGAWTGSRLNLEADSSRKLQDLTIRAGTPGRYTLWAQVLDSQGGKISENNYEFEVKTGGEAR